MLSTANLEMDSIVIAINKKNYSRHGSIILLLASNKIMDSTETKFAKACAVLSPCRLMASYNKEKPYHNKCSKFLMAKML